MRAIQTRKREFSYSKRFTGRICGVIQHALNTLVEYGLVEKRERNYVCTDSFGNWSNTDRHQLFRLKYRSVLEAVAKATGELVLLGVQDGAGIIHIDFIESDQAVRVAPAPVTRHNIRRNAIGKLCIAGRPDLEAIWTAEDPEFADELAAIRSNGVAWNREESVQGMIAMACYARTRNPTEPKIAVAWPKQRFTEEKGATALSAIHDALGQA